MKDFIGQTGFLTVFFKDSMIAQDCYMGLMNLEEKDDTILNCVSKDDYVEIYAELKNIPALKEEIIDAYGKDVKGTIVRDESVNRRF